MKTTKRSLNILLFALLLFCTLILILSANSLPTHGEVKIEIDSSNEGAENKTCDVNKDYYVTISDVTHQLNYLSTLQDSSDESEESELEDVDGDGSVTIADVTAILTRLVIAKNTQVYSSGLEYTLTVDEDCYFVTGMGTCTDSELIIPGEFNGLPVKAIGEGAFENQTEIQKLFIHQGIEELHESAFDSCTALAEVDLPANLKSLEYYTFYNCDSLKSIVLPQGLEQADTYVFYNCPQLTDIWCEFEELEGSTDWQFINSYDETAIRPSNTWTYQNGVPVSTVPSFSGTEGVQYELNNDRKSYRVTGVASDCTKTDIVISPTYNGLYVTSIATYAFESVDATSIGIPEGIKDIEQFAFVDLPQLKALHIPASVTFIEEYSFLNCPGLESITVAKDNKKYYSEQNCLMTEETNDDNDQIITLLLGCKNSTIPKNTTKIANGAFYNCKNLTAVEFPESLVQIGVSPDIYEDEKGEWIEKFYGAFEWCTGLTDAIVIPENVEIITERSFGSCKNIKTFFCEAIRYPDGWVRYSAAGAWNEGCPAPLYFKDFWVYVDGAPTPKEPVVSEGASKGLAYARTADNKAFEVVGLGSCTDSEIVLPATCNDLPVITIGDGAFYLCTEITAVKLSSTITTIKSGAFYNCTGLTDIVLSENLVSIGKDAFYNCDGLTQIILPNSITNIKRAAFEACSNLAMIYCEVASQPSGWVYADPYCWSWNQGCSATVLWTDWWDYVDGKPVAKPLVEKGCSEGLRYTPSYDGTSYYVSGIGTCTDSKIVISPTYMGLPVTYIGYSAFQGCSSITEVVIPDSITKINGYAFDSCKKLTRVVVPESVSYIGNNVFYNCSTLAKIFCEATSKPSDWNSNWINYCPATVYWCGWWSYVDGKPVAKSLIEEGCSEGLTYTANSDGAGYTVSGIGSCTDSTIFISPTYYGLPVTAIKTYAFENCSNIIEVVIPESITSINYSAFYGCSGLSKIFCEATSKPSGWASDWKNGCSATIYWRMQWEYADGEPTIKPPTKVEGSEGLQYSLNDDGTCYTISGIGTCTDSKIVIPSTYNYLPVTAIKYGAFYSCSTITEIIIPDSIISIGSDAFRYCSSLVQVTIPNSVTNIGYTAFADCSNLSQIVIPNSVTVIGYNAFADCPKLTEIFCEAQSQPSDWNSYWSRYCSASVYWSDWWSYIDGKPVAKSLVEEGCSEGLTYSFNSDSTSYAVSGIGTCTDSKIVIPSTYNGLPVTTIGNAAFFDCSNIEAIVIPNSVTSIGRQAFANCSGLTQIVIPESVSSIEPWAFGSCAQLTHIYCETSSQPSQWNSWWILGCSATVYWGGQWTYVDGVPTPTA